ncbi:SDR family oxidoreductase [Saccharopolyspora gloriosae]|uniref:3-oxoacyl-[acyl-carrier protein] reductase n=1 Tax=Saccharopolyspora gloriosae TaxID=455344 RepID=A0A840NAH0_9PSEU|nr:SDR family oxidoreductase [Saccharopolyspora gloriosae]MBB5068594.1 3-oxoacyl-[acyl-carrier protein] reductase [Saccharopolyspora gloriosae]
MTAAGEQSLAREPYPLRGRTALVTGVSRRQGIGFAIASRMAAWGASVFLHHHRPHDAEQPWGADDLDEVRAGVAGHLSGSARIADAAGDLADPDEPARLVRRAVAEFGRLDVLVCNHARSGSDGALGELDAAMLDGHWAVNTRSSLLLAQEFAARHSGSPSGRVVFLTSGQRAGPMPGEIAYAAAKGALAEITATIAEQLADAGITVNTVNPGPVQTGYLTEADWAAIGHMFPFGRWGEPDDPARLITWLCTDEARWITGQVIESEGGFARYRQR